MQSAAVSSHMSSPMQSKISTAAGDNGEMESEYPACGVRIRLQTLEFVGNTVGTMGMFDTVSFRAAVQLAGPVPDGGPLPRWKDDGPHTEARTLKFGRSISEDGKYSAKFCVHFDEAVDLPWPQPAPVPEQIAVDLFAERTTVVDHFDRVLGNLGLHSPAGADRCWLGRAVADLPPEGVDDLPFAWPVQGGGSVKHQHPVPQTMSVGVEWVYQPLDQL